MWSANATNNFFILQNLTTCFCPYGLSSGDNYRNYIQYVLFLMIFILLQYIHYIHDYEAIYCFLIYIYTVLRKFKIYSLPNVSWQICVWNKLV
jgi:hypothetical protein